MKCTKVLYVSFSHRFPLLHCRICFCVHFQTNEFFSLSSNELIRLHFPIEKLINIKQHLNKMRCVMKACRESPYCDVKIVSKTRQQPRILWKKKWPTTMWPLKIAHFTLDENPPSNFVTYQIWDLSKTFGCVCHSLHVSSDVCAV